METTNSIVIGQLIEKELRRQCKSAAWLAQQLECNRTNVYKIFNRPSIDCELLLRISNALSHNFFDVYTMRLGGASKAARR
ncbi:MAG: XRE family transcriptional regulator [Bacteroidales bacterium]|nr:XRE family transcriptional regulator [Bacteroidales bacterium]MCC8176927.1 XRE family transcriptional regulator [Bacteroidales bacterium]